MDYEEFEYIYCDSGLDIQKSSDKKHLVFKYHSDNQRQCEIVEKYKDMSPEEFDKHWFPCLAKYKHKQRQRDPIIAEFKTLKPTDFSNMPNTQKFKYLDALTIDNRHPKEKEQDFSGAETNIKACLFSIRAGKTFWAEEKAKANLFISALIGTGRANDVKNASERTSEQKKEDIHKFIDLFCKVYDTPRPEVIFKDPQSPYAPYCSASPDGKSIRLAESFLNNKMQWHDYGAVFHEMIHIYQNTLFDKDPEKYKMFSPWYTRLKSGTWIATQGNDDEKYKKAYEIYELLPSEAHAYGIQTSFDELFEERILGKRGYTLGKMDYRNVYFGWTRD